MVVRACHPGYAGKHKWKDNVHTDLDINQNPASKITNAKLQLECKHFYFYFKFYSKHLKLSNVF
jgi:hypothetical protein